MAREREIEGIETVGALKEALEGLPDDMPVGDCFCEGIMLTVFKDDENGKRFIVFQ
jgi:hypothetical protein